MKNKFRLVKRESMDNLYSRKIETDIIIKKKGWFGWKTLNLIYNQLLPNGAYYKWCYFKEPEIRGHGATFKTKREAAKFLKNFIEKVI